MQKKPKLECFVSGQLSLNRSPLITRSNRSIQPTLPKNSTKNAEERSQDATSEAQTVVVLLQWAEVANLVEALQLQHAQNPTGVAQGYTCFYVGFRGLAV